MKDIIKGYLKEIFRKDYFDPCFMVSNFRRKYMIPDLEVKNISGVDISALKERGIKGIIYDVDNTLCIYHGEEVYRMLKPTIDRMNREFSTCIISNTSFEKRKKLLEKFFGVHVIQSPHMKPRPQPFEDAMRYLGTRPDETAMIGDRLLTDIVGANKLGMYSILVHPLDVKSEPVPARVVRGIEYAVYRMWKKT